MSKVYAAFFMGWGGSILSPGIQLLGALARNNGVTAEVFDYQSFALAASHVEYYRAKGYKIALLGYSAGCSTIGYMQAPNQGSMPGLGIKNDLFISLAQSQLTINYPINKTNTKRSVLYHSTVAIDILSTAGTDLGYTKIKSMVAPHLFAQFDPALIKDILAELAALQKAA